MSAAVAAAIAAGMLVRGAAPGAARWAAVTPTDPRVSGVFATLSERGLAAALDSLERQAAADSLVLRAGHQLAHALGRQAQLAGSGPAAAIGECRPVFGSGCYHGVVEAYLGANHRPDIGALERMCESAAAPDAIWPAYECVHGLGHGLLGATRSDVPAALRQCDKLSRSILRSSCHEGVFMEAITTAVTDSGRDALPHHPAGPAEGRLRLDPKDPYAPCRAVESRYADSCWLFQGFVILRRDRFDAGRSMRVCDDAPADRVARCYESIGHQLAGLFQRGDGWVVAQCRAGKPELASRCAAGAVLAFAAMDWSGRRVARFCASVPDEWKGDCRETYEVRLRALAARSQG